MRFWLGTHEPYWLAREPIGWMVSRNRLERRPANIEAVGPWVLDSGGFTELSQHGGWRINAKRYADDVRRYAETIGRLEWAAPQDWMCEPWIVARSGLSVGDHQALTVTNYVELRSLDLPVPVIPVLQGWSLADYDRCRTMYERLGVDLAACELVGLGSVCRRQDSDEIGAIVATYDDLRLHGFGCKTLAVARYGAFLASADSLAWSSAGRHRGTCPKRSRCANCLHFALEWRASLADVLPGVSAQMALPV